MRCCEAMHFGRKPRKGCSDLNAELEARVAERTAQLEAEAAERREAEATIRQMQKMESIGQLTGGIAHDFNNMLAIVTGSLDMARRRLKGSEDPRVARSIDNAAEGARRAAVLTQRLLAFSRQQPLEPQPLDANRLVTGMSELIAPDDRRDRRGRDRARRRALALLRRSRPARERADQSRGQRPRRDARGRPADHRDGQRPSRRTLCGRPMPRWRPASM